MKGLVWCFALVGVGIPLALLGLLVDSERLMALGGGAIATVVVAGVVTGLVAGMTPMEILEVLGNSFITQRTATLFVLTLPVIGISERYGLKDKAVDFIGSIKGATTGTMSLS